MKTTIETIGGKKCTVIRRPFDAEWVREQLAMGIPMIMSPENGGHWCVHGVYPKGEYDIITALPPLPRHPKPEHAKLLYRYASEGLDVCGDGHEYCITVEDWTNMTTDVSFRDGGEKFSDIRKITHCVDEAGNRVDVAIEEGE